MGSCPLENVSGFVWKAAVLLKRKHGSLFFSFFRHVKKDPNWFF